MTDCYGELSNWRTRQELKDHYGTIGEFATSREDIVEWRKTGKKKSEGV